MSDSIHTIGCRESFVKSKAQYIVYFIQKDALYIVLRMKRPNDPLQPRGRAGATKPELRRDVFRPPFHVGCKRLFGIICLSFQCLLPFVQTLHRFDPVHLGVFYDGTDHILLSPNFLPLPLKLFLHL